MSISTATELKTALANWAKRDDLSDRMDEFIVLAEAGINRSLRVRAMEASLASTALTDGAVTLPSDFLAFKELRYDGSPSYTLSPRPLEWIRAQSDLADWPIYFAVTGLEVVCWPQSGSVKGTYYKAIPSLASNSSNWLLTQAPDLYLFAGLTEIAVYSMDEGRAVMWRQRARALIDEIQSSDNANQLNGGPLTVRAR